MKKQKNSNKNKSNKLKYKKVEFKWKMEAGFLEQLKMELKLVREFKFEEMGQNWKENEKMTSQMVKVLI